MYHSITFNNLNSYTDFHLYPSSRPVIKPPTLKTNYVELKGADGQLDLTDALSNGEPIYKNREGSWEFIVENGHNWIEVYNKLLDKLHGRQVKVYLEDDPEYYYKGRVTITAWTSPSDGKWSTVTMGYVLEPYKYSKNGDKSL